MEQARLAAMAALHVVRVGAGRRVVLVHGSATDHTTWSIQLASPLRDQFELVAVDRRFEAGTVEAHAADLAELGRALYVGSSFGAVTVLELARTRPELVAGMVLVEPPMAPGDDPALFAGQRAFFAEFDRRVATEGGPAAGEFFLRTVLGDAAYDRIPLAFLDRSKARWAEIRADSEALIAYRPRYAELARVPTPALLVGGDRSAVYFRPTLDSLAAALPNARLEVVPGGHMLHAEAPRQFARLLVGFAEQIEIG
jgi:pimeloyl-ACP methyl ester carboxylesterase